MATVNNLTHVFVRASEIDIKTEQSMDGSKTNGLVESIADAALFKYGTLPKDILSMIVDTAGIADLKSMERINKVWKEVANTPLVMKKLFNHLPAIAKDPTLIEDNPETAVGWKKLADHLRIDINDPTEIKKQVLKFYEELPVLLANLSVLFPEVKTEGQTPYDKYFTYVKYLDTSNDNIDLNLKIKDYIEEILAYPNYPKRNLFPENVAKVLSDYPNRTPLLNLLSRHVPGANLHLEINKNYNLKVIEGHLKAKMKDECTDHLLESLFQVFYDIYLENPDKINVPLAKYVQSLPVNFKDETLFLGSPYITLMSVLRQMICSESLPQRHLKLFTDYLKQLKNFEEWEKVIRSFTVSRIKIGHTSQTDEYERMMNALYPEFRSKL